MKKGNVFAAVIVVLGVLIAVLPSWGPAAVCPLPEGGRWMKCHWMGMAELGVGALVALLGVLMFLQKDRGVRKGLAQALAGISVLAAALPGGLIGGCKNLQMPCQTISIPVLYVLSAGLLLSSLLALRAACGQD